MKSAYENYIEALRTADLTLEVIAATVVVVQTPTRFFIITTDHSGDFVLGVFEDGGHRPVPLKEGTLLQCLAVLSFENTIQ